MMQTDKKVQPLARFLSSNLGLTLRGALILGVLVLLSIIVFGVWITSRISPWLSVGLVVFCCYHIWSWIKKYGSATFNIGPVPVLPDLTLPEPAPPGFKRVRFVCVSDTHNLHNSLVLPTGDVLLHAGDFTRIGTVKEIAEFNRWLGSLPYQHKVVIPGNHDLALDEEFYEKNWNSWHKVKEDCKIARSLLTNCTYLIDEMTTVEGIKIYGSPQQPYLKKMAFSRERGEELRRWWDKIPPNIDILLTHTPPRGKGDRVILGNRVGCEELEIAVKRIKPKFHVFGHIHEAFGVERGEEITYINAACCNLFYKAYRKPIIFDVYTPIK